MLNLAALRYRACMASSGGPIARLEIADTTILGRREFLANAYLREGLADIPWQHELFGNASGSGVAPSPMVARFMAISESMERWAHWQTYAGEDRAKYGFDVDPSTTGMAAFPGVFRRQARRGALMEAGERFNLLNWWEGRLPAAEAATEWPGVRAAVICSTVPGVTVILFRHTPEGLVAYGHGSAMDYSSACRKAAVEMDRHALVLARHMLAHTQRGGPALSARAHPLERRSLFFASEAGHELFLERLRSTPRRSEAKPHLVFDGAIPGPWTPYADVWRVIYEPPSDRFLGDEENYFFW